jgi:hypothetical protein
VIDGFRKNDREVAAFRFSDKGRAYANNTPAGDARNVGVIGTALFDVRLDERDPDLPRRPAPAVESGDPRDPSAFRRMAGSMRRRRSIGAETVSSCQRPGSAGPFLCTASGRSGCWHCW